jgi:hypothetical protein
MRRFQLCLEDEQYRLVASLARANGVSIGSVIRDAIDVALPVDAARRERAARRFLLGEAIAVPDMEEELARLRRATVVSQS